MNRKHRTTVVASALAALTGAAILTAGPASASSIIEPAHSTPQRLADAHRAGEPRRDSTGEDGKTGKDGMAARGADEISVGRNNDSTGSPAHHPTTPASARHAHAPATPSSAPAPALPSRDEPTDAVHSAVSDLGAQPELTTGLPTQ
ncbi:hypothetical protein [Pseudonocardia spinosispora]|uniref:hypothetical protein n=1 Tax=Pseudonocardia spinosispora TaxID=103441 RepID=UPI0004189B7E|nr:hypothetical protein [Pseudonocardia spinosispora]